MTSSRLHRIATPAEPETPRDAIPGVAPSEEIPPAELRLASRNHDIPVVDPAVWRLTVGGRVRRELSLSLTDLRARPAMTRAVTLECAGNGGAHLSPRPVSQPWLLETVGTAEWTGTSLRGLLEEAGADGRASRFCSAASIAGSRAGTSSTSNAASRGHGRRAKR